jgi:hypothetical protein
MLLWLNVLIYDYWKIYNLYSDCLKCLVRKLWEAICKLYLKRYEKIYASETQCG